MATNLMNLDKVKVEKGANTGVGMIIDNKIENTPAEKTSFRKK